MLIVLVRHGDAEKAADNMQDRDRRLTEAGIRSMKASFPHTFRLLCPEGKTAVWCSPLMRARQTAKIVVNSLEKAGFEDEIAPESPEPHDSLAVREMDTVLTEIAKMCKIQRYGTLILVGHDPQISELGSWLTGMPVSFKKGASMCLRLKDEKKEQIAGAEEPAAVREAFREAFSMMWFVQGPALRCWTNLSALEKIFSDGFQRVTDCYERFCEKPDDVDSVHDLRVSIRSLRSMISFIVPYQNKRQNHRIQKRLRAAVVQLSRLREYDVLIEECAEAGEAENDLKAYLAETRKREVSRVHARLTRPEFKKSLEKVGKELNNLHWRGKIMNCGIETQQLEDRFAAIAKKFADDYRELDFDDHDAVHKVRKEAKRVRYAAAGFKPVIGDRSEILGEMREVQDALGNLCDARVNIHLLAEIRKRGKKLPRAVPEQVDRLLNIEIQMQNTALLAARR